MYEDDLDDEWARILREDEEEMARKLDETWLEAEDYKMEDEEYKMERDRFGDG